MKLRSLMVESYRRGVVFSSTLNVVAQFVGFVTNLAIAYYFGTQAKTDVYFYCLSAIALVIAFFGNLNSAVLLPECMRIREQEGEQAGMGFVNLFLLAYLLLGLAGTAALLISPVKSFTAISSFDAGLLQEHRAIVVYSVPIFLLTLIAFYLIDVLTSFKYFTVPMLSSILSRLVILAFLVCGHRRLDILSVLWGTLIAALLQLGLLVQIYRDALKWKFHHLRYRVRPQVIRNLLLTLAGGAVTFASSFLPLYLLSGLGSGVITALNYGQRVAAIPATFITTQFSAVLAIKLNDLWARGRRREFSETFERSVGILVFVLTPVAILGAVYAREIVVVLFKRGAFDEESVRGSALFVRYLSLLLPFLAINMVVARLLMAAQKIPHGFVYQVCSNLLLLALIAAGVRAGGAYGYLLALLAHGLLNTALIHPLLRAARLEVAYSVIPRKLAKAAAINLPPLAAALAAALLFTAQSELLRLIGGTVLYGLVLLLVIACAPRLEEAAEIRTLLRETLRRRQPAASP